MSVQSLTPFLPDNEAIDSGLPSELILGVVDFLYANEVDDTGVDDHRIELPEGNVSCEVAECVVPNKGEQADIDSCTSKASLAQLSGWLD